jgi:hypothetical protein
VLGESPPAVVSVGKVGLDPKSEDGGSVVIQEILPTAGSRGNQQLLPGEMEVLKGTGLGFGYD